MVQQSLCKFRSVEQSVYELAWLHSRHSHPLALPDFTHDRRLFRNTSVSIHEYNRALWTPREEFASVLRRQSLGCGYGIGGLVG